MSITKDDAKEFVGGGDRDFSDAEVETRAAEIATSANSYERWAEGRDLAERMQTNSVLTRDSDGNETTTDVAAVGWKAEDAITSPEANADADADADPDDGNE